MDSDAKELDWARGDSTEGGPLLTADEVAQLANNAAIIGFGSVGLSAALHS